MIHASLRRVLRTLATNQKPRIIADAGLRFPFANCPSGTRDGDTSGVDGCLGRQLTPVYDASLGEVNVGSCIAAR
jgi:hypothetical protein